MLDFLGLFLFFAGFIIGLGAVTVIDFHGLLARKSSYWTKATIQTHKITKPLIWIGIILAIVGGAIFYRKANFAGVPLWQTIIALALIINGLFLSFVISPNLIAREKQGRAEEILPDSTQTKITVSFFVSFFGWWGAVILLVWYLVS